MALLGDLWLNLVPTTDILVCEDEEGFHCVELDISLVFSVGCG